MEIRLLKGPLEKYELQQIAGLYGQTDYKYAQVSYCEYLFNHNPYGFSYHAFAMHNGYPVGHIAVIPMQIDTPKGMEISLKAEAFYLDPDLRNEWVTVEDDEVPIGLALPKTLYNFALRDNYKVIHLMADEEIGKIHQFAGCKKISFNFNERFLILSDTEYKQREMQKSRKTLISSVFYIQLAIRTISSCLISIVWKRNSMIEKYSKTIAVFPSWYIRNPWQWSISISKIYQSWFYSSPYISIYAYDKSLDNYIVVKECEYPNRATEILGCYSKNGDLGTIASILNSIIKTSKAKQASSIILKHFPNQTYPLALQAALTLFGFVTKKSVINCYVKSSETYYQEKDNLAYSQLYYIQF